MIRKSHLCISTAFGLLAAATALGAKPDSIRLCGAPSADAKNLLVDDAGMAGAYNGWLDSTLAKISGDDDHDQREAAQKLTLALPYAPARGKVLAALRPHLNSSDSNFRQICVRAFAHWAVAAQAPELVNVVATPPNPPNMSGAEPCWAAAVGALIGLDPDAAKEAAQSRMGDFFFRADMAGELRTIAADRSMAEPVAYDMLRRFDPDNPAIKLSVQQAMALLQSDSARDRSRGAAALALQVVDKTNRDNVLALLKLHVMGDNGRARLVFVQAYTHWASAREVPTLKAIVAYPPTVTGLTGQEDCWAAATAGLARLDPVAAGQAMDSRSDSFFYRVSLTRLLQTLAERSGPSQRAAAWLLARLDPTNQPPLPPDYRSGGSPAPGAPGRGSLGASHQV